MDLTDVDALILAGGLGTRLRSVVADRPKVVAPVRGRPFLAYLLDQLEQAGCRRAVLMTGYQADVVEQTIGARHGGMEIRYSPEPSPLGTGGAIRLALPHVSSPTVLALNGDSYCHADLARLVDHHRRAAAEATITLTHVEDSARYGRVEVDKEFLVRRFHEKGASGPGWINAGLYALESEWVASIPAERAVSIERELFGQGDPATLAAYPGGGRFIDIGTPESFAEAERFFAGHARRLSGRPMVLLDRDGTIIVEKEYLSDPAGVELVPNAAAGLRALRNLGFSLAVVTNQSGVARGYFDGATLERIHDRLRSLLLVEGVWLDAIYCCPHAPDDGCDCRKPKSGMVQSALEEFRFDPAASWVIGDKACDIDLGKATGLGTILVQTGYGRTELARGVAADLTADDLSRAAELLGYGDVRTT